MPVSPRTAGMQESPGTHPGLRPYIFHGLDLTVRGGHGVGECPFCGGAGNISICVETTRWRCWSCGGGQDSGGGNAATFIRALHAVAAGAGGPGPAAIAADRRLGPGTPAAWGACLSPVDGAWMVPGYAPNGEVWQLYRRVWLDGKWLLLPTPGVWPDGRGHGLHLPAGDFDPSCPDLYICEGPWDGMAFWEAARASSIAPGTAIAVPGCNVWRDEWTEFCRGKRVTLLFDSDHPRKEGRITARAGYDGMKRVARRLSGAAESCRILRWGPDGYDPARPSGWDVRDHLTTNYPTDSPAAFADLLSKVEDAPADWFGSTPVGGASNRSHTSIEPLDCSSWSVCEDAWREALLWRRDMSDMLAIILAVCASTNQGGNQLFMDLVGAPGSAKTTILRGALTSHHCIHLENITKVISGHKKRDENEKDCSFLARANNKTWITCEFDVILSSPQYTELMSKMRRIFDGETSSTYANTDTDRIYNALRTPWIRAGTKRMMDHDQSQLGDRFLRFIIGDPSEDEKRAILRSAVRLERVSIMESANGTAGSILDPQTRLAYALTGGYINWLHANIEQLLARIDIDERAEDHCIDLADLSADLRARPNADKRKLEPVDTKELPTRLARQNIRLATCLAVVLNKQMVDADVLRIVRKVAMDTSHGHSLNIVGWLCARNPGANGLSYQESSGHAEDTIRVWTRMTPERLETYLGFLDKIDVIQFRARRQTGGAWFLTERVYDLYRRIMGA